MRGDFRSGKVLDKIGEQLKVLPSVKHILASRSGLPSRREIAVFHPLKSFNVGSEYRRGLAARSTEKRCVCSNPNPNSSTILK